MADQTDASRTFAEVVEIVYRTHGCSCEEHPSNGATASCNAERRRSAERVAAALRLPEDGGMALHSCPRCDGPLIPTDQRMCWDCALAATSAKGEEQS